MRKFVKNWVDQIVSYCLKMYLKKHLKVYWEGKEIKSSEYNIITLSYLNPKGNWSLLHVQTILFGTT